MRALSAVFVATSAGYPDHDHYILRRTVSGERTVDPYEDVDVIDVRAPRFNQATVALLSAVALLTGWWWLIGLLALQLVVGLRLGRRYCLPCVLYFEVVQPRIGEGEIEDARPPRFANVLGALVLTVATLAYVLGWDPLGDALAGIVALLASAAAITGFCLGCRIYRVLARLRGIRPGGLRHLDLDEIGVSPGRSTVVQFTHPLCTGCRSVTKRLQAEGREVILVDISTSRNLAQKYGITVVPTALAVGQDGEVLARLA
jgi:thiol-disulfide isomerase/thioredoxin